MKPGLFIHSLLRLFAVALLILVFFHLTSAAHSARPTTSLFSADYLNPNTGRFWTMDSYEGNQEDPFSLHKYLYCQADPVNNVDPSGNEIEGALTVMDVTAGLASPKMVGASPGRMIKGRPLTQGEIDLAQPIFGSEIYYTLPKVLNRPWVFQPRDTGVTPNGNIHARGDGTDASETGGAYRSDYSTEDIDGQRWFIHEMTHVWQSQHGMWVILRRGFWASYEYNFLTLGKKDIKKYGIEQQAEIVADLFLLKNNRTRKDKDGNPLPPIEVYLKVLRPSFPEL